MAPAHTIPTLPDRFRFTPEFRLLVTCSWFAPGEREQVQSQSIRRLCDEGIDWDSFTGLVVRHRIPALVYANLCRVASGYLPAEVRERLKQHSDQARRQALHLAAESLRILRRFSAEGITALPLKGPILSQQIFNDPAVRQCRDIDLLVKPEDLEHAERILLADGFLRDPEYELTARQRRFVVMNMQHFCFAHSVSGSRVELHWQLSLWTENQALELWNHCQRMEIGAQIVTGMDGSTQLLYLCSHGMNHVWFRLKWLSDIAMLLSRIDQPDVDALIDLAARLEMRRPLAQAALLAHWLYGMPLPDAISRLVSAEKSVASLCDWAVSDLLAPEEEAARPGKHLRSIPYFLKIKNGLPLRRHLMMFLINPGDFHTYPLPDSLFWLYCPLRPVLWFRHHFLRT